MSGESIFNDVDSIYINNNEVQSIKRVDDGAIIYEKTMALENPMVLTVSGNNFSEANENSRIFGDNIIVDYGDGTIESLIGKLTHNYEDGIESHQIKIYNISELGDNCFAGCRNLISVVIPDGVTNIGIGCFTLNTNLTSILISNSVTNIGEGCFHGSSSIKDYYLNWTTPPITWDNITMEINEDTVFHIPYGTTDAYIAKEFPIDKLQEPILWQPALDGTTPVINNGAGYYSSQDNGVWTFTNAFLSGGWENKNHWKAEYDLNITGLRYIWIGMLVNANNTRQKIGMWEGGALSWENCSNISKTGDNISMLNGSIWRDPSTPQMHITIERTGETELTITKTGDNINNGTAVITWAELPNITHFTVGARNNNGQNHNGKVQIRNLIVYG